MHVPCDASFRPYKPTVILLMLEQIFLAQPPNAWVGTVCSTPNKTSWRGVTCSGDRVVSLQLSQYSNLLSGETMWVSC